MDTTETQYTQKEVAEMLQNADDISKQLKKQDKNANIIAGILVKMCIRDRYIGQKD